jgi:pimeloyl-ACP methyl ester carboxylesterase
MAGDVLALLDALHVQQVHMLGLSMGGMIAQELVASHPDRILSLTLLSTTAHVADPDLPGLSSS